MERKWYGISVQGRFSSDLKNKKTQTKQRVYENNLRRLWRFSIHRPCTGNYHRARLSEWFSFLFSHSPPPLPNYSAEDLLLSSALCKILVCCQCASTQNTYNNFSTHFLHYRHVVTGCAFPLSLPPSRELTHTHQGFCRCIASKMVHQYNYFIQQKRVIQCNGWWQNKETICVCVGSL